MKLLIAFAMTFVILSVHADDNDDDKIIKAMFENSKFSSLATRMDNFETGTTEFAARFQKNRKSASILHSYQTQDMKILLNDLSKMKTDLSAVSFSSSSVWEQVQSKILHIQISEFEAMLDEINLLIIGQSHDIAIPEFHHSGSLNVARAFLEHNLITVTIDVVKAERYMSDSTKRSEVQELLRDIVQVSKDSRDELQHIFSNVNHALRTIETPTLLSLSQKNHALTTMKIYHAIQTVAQEKLDKM